MELMVAAAVLLLGMVGVSQLLISGVTGFSDANAAATGQTLSASGCAEFQALPFAAVTPGISDGGVFVIDGRRYGRINTVLDVGDGGLPARLVRVSTEWSDSLRRLRQASNSVIISGRPDAG
jgi:hypothetical protein